ncbi:MAG: aldose 1-epimerase family protein [Clostridia bacterium]|nr:aldose 1-epimerase family protein [Clostridia bacterium]
MNDKRTMMKYAGSMQQAAYIRPLRYDEGRSRDLKALEVKNGPLCFKLLADKCLDIAELSYRGVNFSFMAKPGLQGLGPWDTHGEEAVRSIMGGMMFTSGVENICAPCTIRGVDYPMHGRMRSTPAEHLCTDAFWGAEGYRLTASGEMREAALFGENMVLRRRVDTVYGQKRLTVTDVIENESAREEPMMLLYHINLGWPLLDEDLHLRLPTRKVTPRDAEADGHEGAYDRMDPPKDNEPEYVFIHDLKHDDAGDTCAIAWNGKLALGLQIEWNVKNLPFFMEWKSTASGDYALGLEPANSSVYGRPWHEARNSVHTLAPFAREENTLTFTVLDGMAEIEAALSDFDRRFQNLK